MASERRYLCPFCNKRYTKRDMVTHLGRSHSKSLPEGFTPLQATYHIVNRRPMEYKRKCRICGEPTSWDEKKGRYNFLCGKPACDKAWVKQMKDNMGDKYGAYRPTSSAEGLEKMLAGRKISGKYTFRDGHEFTYTGSYERSALEFLDKVMEVKSEDLMVPGPVLTYTFKGQKHMYITDMLYTPYNLIIEVKDGGSNPNTNAQLAEVRAKQMAKEDHIIKHTEYNYLRLTDKDNSQLFNAFAELKLSSMEEPPYRIVNVNESVNEDCIIISCFAGVGKNYAMDYLNRSGIDYASIEKLDKTFDKSKLVENIKKVSKNNRVVFIPYYLGIDKDIKGKIKYTIVYPDINLKSVYIDRFKMLGFTKDQIEYINTNFEDMIKDIEKSNCGKYKLKSENSYLLDFLEKTSVINEAFDNNFKKSKKFDLNSFSKKKIDKALCDKYNTTFDNTNLDDDGYAWFDGDKLVATVVVDKSKHPYWLYNLGVEKDYRGNGIGNQVLDFAVKKLGAEALTVKKTNDIAINMYKKYGFEARETKGGQKDMDYMYLPDVVKEGVFFDDKDIYYNKDKFDSGEINLCFIVGMSGSGKTTMSHKYLNQKNVEVIELDDNVHISHFDSNNLVEYGKLMSSFWNNSHGDELRERMVAKDNTHITCWEVQHEFIDYAMKFAASHKNIKFVLEGIWALEEYKPEELKDYAVFIKGTGYIKSTIRASVRQFKSGKGLMEKISGGFNQFINSAWFAKTLDSKLKAYRSYFGPKSVVTEMVDPVEESMFSAMGGFFPMQKNDVVMINYMRKNSYIDDEYCMALDQKLNKIYARDDEGVIREFGREFLEGCNYTPYIVSDVRSVIEQEILSSIGQYRSKNFIFETVFGHPKYTNDQIMYEKAAKPYKDYYKMLSDTQDYIASMFGNEINSPDLMVNEAYYNPDIIKRYNVKYNTDNCCLIVKGFDKPVRGRSIMIILRKSKNYWETFYMYKENHINPYKFPGGGWDPGEDPMDAAIREAQEEARMNVSDVRYYGSYIIKLDEPIDWVKENIRKKDWWYGYYTEIFVGLYESKYTGRVAKIDQDELSKKGKWGPVDEILPLINIKCRKAIESYIKENESLVTESYSNPDIIKRYSIKSDNGADNCCIMIKGYEKPFRGRSTMIVLRQGNGEWETFLIQKNAFFNPPGGGWDPKEEPIDAAIRETQEEARINVSDVRYYGKLIEYYEEAEPWVKEHVKNEKDWWYGYYTEIYVGMYDSDYTGDIDEVDQDPMAMQGKWYPISEIKDKIPLEYSKAIEKYITDLGEVEDGQV